MTNRFAHYKPVDDAPLEVLQKHLAIVQDELAVLRQSVLALEKSEAKFKEIIAKIESDQLGDGKGG